MHEFIPLALCAGLLLAAAASDVATMTIPNWVSVALAATYPVAAFLSGAGWQEIALHLAFGFGILIVMFLAFQANLFGGGDAKLIAGCAVWTGWTAFLPFLFWMCIAGGVIALILLFVRRAVKPSDERPRFLNRLLKPRGGVPYGVAIAFGGIVALDMLSIANNVSQLTTP